MSICRALLLGVVALMPGIALAHTGQAAPAGIAAGFAHPLTGPDHLAALVAVSLLAAHLGGRALAALPIAFVLVLALSGAAAMDGAALPALELGIVLSTVALGGLLLLPRALPQAPVLALVALFAVFHGHAHGAEVPAGADALAYGAGFVLATAALHGVGVAAGLTLARVGAVSWARYAGLGLVLGTIGLAAA